MEEQRHRQEEETRKVASESVQGIETDGTQSTQSIFIVI